MGNNINVLTNPRLNQINVRIDKALLTQGIQGDAGSTIYNGASNPASAFGLNKDYYLNNSTNDLFNKVNGAWVFISNIKGVAGMAGLQGLQGIQGLPGATNYADLTNKPTIPSAQVASDWSSITGITQILNKPTFANVALTGSYDDLSNKPTIPASQVATDWNSLTGLSAILNKPSLDNYLISTNIIAGTNITLVKLGNNITIAISYSYSLPVASSIVSGGVKVDGTSITVLNGVISATATSGTSYTLPSATLTTLGGVIVPTNGNLKIEIIDGSSAIGGGAAPAVELKTMLIAVTHKKLSVLRFEKLLRAAEPPIIARIVDDHVVVDLRTVAEADELKLLEILIGLG